MDSSTQTSADAKHTCICSELFELAEKLRIDLHKKDEELHKREQEKEVCKLFLHVHTVNKYFCAQSEIVNRFGAGKSSSRSMENGIGQCTEND
jgi:hypothetical protein